MAGFNVITNGRFSSAIQRLFWIKGDTPAPECAPEIGPSIDVNQMDDPTMQFLRNERICAGCGASPPTAANYTKVGLDNPPNSGMVAVIEYWDVKSDILATIYMNIIAYAGAAQAAGAGTRYLFDSRWRIASAGLPTPVCQVYTGVNPGAPTAAGAAQFINLVTANVPVVGYGRIVLGPGCRFEINHPTVTTPTLVANFRWWERPIALEEQATG